MKIVFFSLVLVMGWAASAKENFSEAESNFKVVMQKLLEKYVNKNLTEDQLYEAATQGMLQSLNAEGQAWNQLLSPQDLRDLDADLSGKVTGIGATLKFDERTGYGEILKALPGSPAEKAGLKTDDQILSVDGKRFKGQHLQDLVKSIRGEVGKSIELKILREDKILNVSLKRDIVPWTPVEFEKVGEGIGLLSIGFFSAQTPSLVEAQLKKVNSQGFKRLIVDLRDNEGGGFEQAVRVAELFLPENSTIASTKNRNGSVEKFSAQKGILNKDIQLVLLTNKGTFCGAELVAAALKENKNLKLVGETTFGKWNAQSVETLPNHFAMKYTVQEFLSPQGHSFQGVGLKPDVEVSLPKDVTVRELRAKYSVAKRLDVDVQLKAAFELIQTL